MALQKPARVDRTYSREGNLRNAEGNRDDARDNRHDERSTSRMGRFVLWITKTVKDLWRATKKDRSVGRGDNTKYIKHELGTLHRQADAEQEQTQTRQAWAQVPKKVKPSHKNATSKLLRTKIYAKSHPLDNAESTPAVDVVRSSPE